jgi:hypothetical protein
MELFKGLRIKIGDNILRNKLASTKRKIYYPGIGMVKEIGILWDASKTEEFTFLSKFCQKMNENKTEVMVLGYFPTNNLPNQYTAIRYLSVIKKEELNFFYHPVSAESVKFVNKQFDVLIDLNFKKLLPLQYISSLSKAYFKVGLFEPGIKTSPYDLMMEIKNPVNIDDYLTQVMHYLNMINSETVHKAD